MPARTLTAVSSSGGLTFTAWKRRSSERSFSIDLRYSPGRGRADALDLAARKRRLQDVGGVEGTLSATGTHQGVELVNKDDGVLIFHQFFHDGLQALFELAAILGARHDQGKVEGEDAFIGEERWHFAVGDALGETFDDGGLADAGFADEHRVVLGAAAKDLDDALELGVAADERIELVVHGDLGEVARKLGEQGRLTLPLLRLCFFLRGTCQFLADGRQTEAALVQNLGGEALLFAQQTQQQVLGANVLVGEALSLFRGIGEHTLTLVAQREIDRSRYLLADGGVAFDLFPNGFDRRMLTGGIDW